MSETRGVIQNNPEKGCWEVVIDGKVVTQSKELDWTKSNMRRHVKVRKTGVTKYDVYENGQLIDTHSLHGRKKKVKVVTPVPTVETTSVPEPVAEVETEPVPVPTVEEIPVSEPAPEPALEVVEETEELPGFETLEVGTEVATEEEMVTLEGMEKLEGLTCQGRILSRNGKKKLITIEVRTKNGEPVVFEFHNRSGIQKTTNPHHQWRIQKTA